MIRTVIQWLVSQKVDDGLPLGWILSKIVRYDARSRQYYKDLLRLDNRLRADAVILLEDRLPQQKPLHLLRFAYNPKRDAISRRRKQKALVIVTLSLLFVFGAGIFFSSGILSVSNHAVASPWSATAAPDTTILGDPMIQDELIRLCRQSPNESGPFFSESLR